MWLLIDRLPTVRKALFTAQHEVDVVVCACNPRLWSIEVGRPGGSRSYLVTYYIWGPPISKTNKQNNQPTKNAKQKTEGILKQGESPLTSTHHYEYRFVLNEMILIGTAGPLVHFWLESSRGCHCPYPCSLHPVTVPRPVLPGLVWTFILRGTFRELTRTHLGVPTRLSVGPRYVF